MHGAIFLYLKTEGALQQRIRQWMWRGFGFFLVTYLLVTIASSSATIAALVCLFGLALYPNLVTSRPHLENSLTIYNAASSPKTLGIMAFIVALGMPFVIAYTVIVYWTFRGKVRLEEQSY
jgi:cytochrome d ubiquinol oxidase subunit II